MAPAEDEADVTSSAEPSLQDPSAHMTNPHASFDSQQAAEPFECPTCSLQDGMPALPALPPLPVIDMRHSHLIGTLDVRGNLAALRERKRSGAFEEEVTSQSIPRSPEAGTYPWEIDPKKLVLKNFIAKGTYGTVHRGVFDGKDVAVKLLNWGEDDPMGHPEMAFLREAFIQEVTVWSTLNHKNVTQFIGAILGGSTGFKIPSTVTGHDGHHLVEGHVCCVVLEYLSGGNLKKVISEHRQKKLPLKSVLNYSTDIARGLAYLHSKHIVHRDVKSENMLLDRHKVVKIADFGVSRVENESCKQLKQLAGTYGYMAPEVLMGIPYDHKVDVYSFGILLWEIYCCDNPFPFMHFTPNDIKSFVNQGLRPEIPKCCPEKLASLMRKCWDKDPDKRPDMGEVVEILESMDRHGHGMAPSEFEHLVGGSHHHVFHVPNFINKLSVAPLSFSKVLLVAQLSAAECVPTPGPAGAAGIGFVLLDTAKNEMNLYVSDVLSTDSLPTAAAVVLGSAGVNGATQAILSCSNTFLSSSPFGYAFAGSIPSDSSVLSRILADPSGYYLCVTTQGYPNGAIRGQLMNPSDTATALPSILFPSALIGTQSDKKSLNAALSASVTYTSWTIQASIGESDPQTQTLSSPSTPPPQSYPYLNLTLLANSLANAFPAAMQAITASSSSSSSSSACTADGTCVTASSSAASSTTLTSFLTTILPALPALTDSLPSVGSGQLVEAGLSSLLATVMAYLGFAPQVSPEQMLAALAAAFSSALAVQPD